MGHDFIPTFWGTKDIDKFFVGFDEQWNRLQKLHDDVAKNIPNYPPYNIRKNDENHYTIEIAVAGFGQHDIDIEMNDGKLIIRGNTSNETEEAANFLFKGIANRAFTRSFVLNDEIVVNDAEIVNGMLKIALERLIPEAKQPKKIPVRQKAQKQLLTEGEKDEISSRL